MEGIKLTLQQPLLKSSVAYNPIKSFKYADLVLKKHFELLSMLKPVGMLNIFVKTVLHFFQVSLMKRKLKTEINCNIVNVFTVTFNEFNAE